MKLSRVEAELLVELRVPKAAIIYASWLKRFMIFSHTTRPGRALGWCVAVTPRLVKSLVSKGVIVAEEACVDIADIDSHLFLPRILAEFPSACLVISAVGRAALKEHYDA